jgi:putative addiction module killer protein
MFEIEQTDTFAKWLRKLRDVTAKRRILKRLADIGDTGNFGDHKAVGDGVSELRFFFGSGYRVYYTMRGETIVLLLAGGDKASQSRDIAAAVLLSKEG